VTLPLVFASTSNIQQSTLQTVIHSLYLGNDKSLTVQTGTEKLGALRVFLLSNNKITAWSEVERLGGLTALEELLLVGNPLYNEFKDKGETQQYRIEVCASITFPAASLCSLAAASILL